MRPIQRIARKNFSASSVGATFNQGPFWSNGLSSLWSPLVGRHETIAENFEGYVRQAYKANGVVFACILARLLIFSEARFQYQRFENGRPGDLFGDETLGLLEHPWANATTGELLAHMVQDADLAGNFFATKVVHEGEQWIRRLQPDWMTIVTGSPTEDPFDFRARPIGYIYKPRGAGSIGSEPVFFTPDRIAHWSPIPDPEAQWRGMSPLTPVIREIQADSAATKHKLKFFEHGATTNYVIVYDKEVSQDNVKAAAEHFAEQHGGVDNAYKCLHPDTGVSMWDGSVRAARDIAAGDTVVAWADGAAVPGRVAAAEWQPPSPIVTVETQRGRTVKTNDLHPFLTKRGWVKARDLRPGDLVVTGLGGARDDVPDAITAYESWVLGVMVGDGCFVPNTPTLSAYDEGVRERMRIGYELVHVGGTAPLEQHDYRVRGIRRLVSDAGLLGKRSWEKHIPDSIVVGSAKVKAAFISGLIDSDGHIADPARRRSAEVGITSTSRQLLHQAQHVLASLGINSSVSAPECFSAGEDTSGGFARRHTAYRLCVFGNDQASRLNGLLDLARPELARRLEVFASRGSRQDRSAFDRVVKVEVGTPEPTIGIEVADHHTHVTGGVVTHNTFHLGQGADVKTVGADLKQLDFKVTQGAGETRIAAAFRVHPVIVGLSEGMQGSSLNAGNFNMARRSFADGTIRPLWRSASAALQKFTEPPQGARLWYDSRDIPFLREDAKDEAEIQNKEADTIGRLTDAGYDPDTVVAAVTAGDLKKLVGQHSGLFSVQLQPAGAGDVAPKALTTKATAAQLPALLKAGWTLVTDPEE